MKFNRVIYHNGHSGRQREIDSRCYPSLQLCWGSNSFYRATGFEILKLIATQSEVAID